MRDDYLWDGSGEPDPEVRRLEALLSRFGYDRPTPEFPQLAASRGGIGIRVVLVRFAVAATLVAVIGVAWLVVRMGRPAWEVATLQGTPRVGSDTINDTGRLTVGQWLVTDGASRARISVGEIGQVHVEPNSRVRLLQAKVTEHRLALERGALQATIWAPPRLFFVNTPSAVATDLGCAYTLHVDRTGSGLLHVMYGWVAFELNGRESFVPQGALCATRPGIGPGTPYFEDAPKPFEVKLAALDFGALGPQDRAEALRLVLTEARVRDAFTLWHLLSRVEGDERVSVYDRLAELVPPPSDVTREGVLRSDKPMLGLWWDQLGLKDTSWWRMWKGPTPLQQK